MHFKGLVLIRNVASLAEFWSDNVIQLIYMDLISIDHFVKTFLISHYETKILG